MAFERTLEVVDALAGECAGADLEARLVAEKVGYALQLGCVGVASERTEGGSVRRRGRREDCAGLTGSIVVVVLHVLRRHGCPASPVSLCTASSRSTAMRNATRSGLATASPLDLRCEGRRRADDGLAALELHPAAHRRPRQPRRAHAARRRPTRSTLAPRSAQRRVHALQCRRCTRETDHSPQIGLVDTLTTEPAAVADPDTFDQLASFLQSVPPAPLFFLSSPHRCHTLADMPTCSAARR